MYTYPDSFNSQLQADKGIGFTSALLGLIFEPYNVVEKLLHTSRPRHALPMLLLLAVSLTAPIISWANHRNLLTNAKPFLLAGFVLVGLSLSMFLLGEFLLLAVFRVRCSFSHLVALVSYLGIPLALAAGFSCFFDYLFSGSLTIQEQLLTTLPIAHTASVRALIVLLAAATFWDLLILFFGIRVLGALDSTAAFLLAIMSQGLFILGLALSFACAELVQIGFIERVFSLFSVQILPW